MAVSRLPEIRNVRFKIGKHIPKYWFGGRRAHTIFFNNLSSLFPEGERFFIHSVKHFRHLATDPELQAAVRAFMGQEGVHGREHEAYNDLVASHGYRIERIEKETTLLLETVKKTLPKRWQLAATAALEHFTAILAKKVLEDPRLSEGSHPAMAALWRWHAAEELEHRAVAYDLYIKAGGNYPERVGIMTLAALIFWLKVLEQQIILMRDDKIASNAGEWLRLVQFLVVYPGPIRRLIPDFLDYYRPGFHPNDFDATALLDAWRAEYETLPEYQKAS